MDQISVSLNLCDIIGRLPKDVPAAINSLIQAMPYEKADRLYVGSYYCDTYFLNTAPTVWEALFAYAANTGKKVTLVLPPVFEKDFEKIHSRTLALIQAAPGVLDELTVNDFGALCCFENNASVRLYFGRLLQKDSRDIRYEDFFNDTHTHRVFSDYYKQFFAEHHICGLELDCTHATISIPAHCDALTVAVHTPYCCTSVGSICEFAAVHRTGPQKFLYAGPCRGECNSMLLECTYEKKYPYVRLGRSVQFDNSNCKILSAQPYRTVYSPVKELLKGVLS